MRLLPPPLLLGLAQIGAANMVKGVVPVIRFALAFLFFRFFVMGEDELFSRTILRFSGLWQRATFELGYSLFSVTCMIGIL